MTTSDREASARDRIVWLKRRLAKCSDPIILWEQLNNNLLPQLKAEYLTEFGHAYEPKTYYDILAQGLVTE